MKHLYHKRESDEDEHCAGCPCGSRDSFMRVRSEVKCPNGYAVEWRKEAVK